MAKRLTVVLSQGQSQNPAKRGLEEDLVARLLMEPGIDATVVPHLYDLQPDGTAMLCLQGISGDMVVLSWLYERAARWILDRNDVRGQVGTSLILNEDDDEDEDDDGESAAGESDDDKQRVVDFRAPPSRKIYCIDLRADNQAATYVDEIKRIAAEANTDVVQLGEWIQGTPAPEQMQRYLEGGTAAGVGANGSGGGNLTAGGNVTGAGNVTGGDGGDGPREVNRVDEEPGRRWYPVIDFSRCTNCMECIDFCLFGVYGVDQVDTILVEQPDNCRKGCPACSRVCPENAIIFPGHKTPAIAGAPGEVAGLKIDLSQLFGGGDPLAMAVAERDTELVADGREAVGMAVGIPKRQTDQAARPRDEMDDLMDGLDDLDL